MSSSAGFKGKLRPRRSSFHDSRRRVKREKALAPHGQCPGWWPNRGDPGHPRIKSGVSRGCGEPHRAQRGLDPKGKARTAPRIEMSSARPPDQVRREPELRKPVRSGRSPYAGGPELLRHRELVASDELLATSGI